MKTPVICVGNGLRLPSVRVGDGLRVPSVRVGDGLRVPSVRVGDGLRVRGRDTTHAARTVSGPPPPLAPRSRRMTPPDVRFYRFIDTARSATAG